MNNLPPSLGILGRRDLLAVLRSNDPSVIEVFQSLLKLEQRPPNADSTVIPPPDPLPPLPVIDSLPPKSDFYPTRRRPLTFWRLTAEERKELEPKIAPVYREWNGWTVQPLREEDIWTPLAPWSELEVRLRPLLEWQCSTAVDVERLVNRVARLEFVRNLPRKQRPAWGRQLYVVRDTSARLWPLDRDQRMVISRLRHLLPPDELWHVKGADANVLRYDAVDHKSLQGHERIFSQPNQSAAVLVLGDLGALEPSGDTAQQWLRWGQRLASAGHHLMVLLPCAQSRLAPELKNVFQVQTWQSSRLIVEDFDERAGLLEELAIAASPGFRLEPGLIRELRSRVLCSADGSLELDFWNTSDWLRLINPIAATPNRLECAEKLLPIFEGWSRNQRGKVLDCFRRWRRTIQHIPEFWLQELMSLSEDSRSLVPQEDVEQACSMHVEFQKLLQSDTEYARRRKDWLETTLPWYSTEALEDEEVSPLIKPLRQALLRDNVDDSQLAPDSSPAETFAVRPQAANLKIDAVRTSIESPEFGPQICDFQSPLRGVKVDLNNSQVLERRELKAGMVFTKNHTHVRLVGNRHEITLQQFQPPKWCDGAGCDRFGPWVEFGIPQSAKYARLRQRLRWIPAGEFWMGSAESEAGRYENELRHRVRLSQGYWLFDSACPQWLWTSVMGSNPSRFQDEFRPVERVSWDDCQGFLSRLNEKLGVSGVFRLPTEAEWEYACRGGSESAIYTGALTIRGAHDGPELDEIAWYGGNSGVGYDLAEGEDAWWSEKQYKFSKCGSRRVKAKLSNPWGLYDMLGNVWEWCSDWYGDYESELCVDPIGADTGSARVVRGGCWSSYARFVRSASRNRFPPRYANTGLGLRPLSAASG